MKTKDMNVYYDVSCNGWKCEIKSIYGWYLYGTYSTYQDAVMMK